MEKPTLKTVLNYETIVRECECGQKYNYVYNSDLECFVQVCPKCNGIGNIVSFDNIKDIHLFDLKINGLETNQLQDCEVKFTCSKFENHLIDEISKSRLKELDEVINEY